MVFRVGTGGGGNERRGEGKELLVRVFRGFDVCLVFFFRKESCPGEEKRVLVVFHQNGEWKQLEHHSCQNVVLGKESKLLSVYMHMK